MFVVDASLNCVPAKNRVSPFVNARRQIGQGMKYVVQNHLSSTKQSQRIECFFFPNPPIEKRVAISMFSTIYRIQIFLRTRPTLSIWNFKNVEYSQKSEQYLGKSRFCKTKWKCWDCLGKLSNRLGKRAFPKWALDKKG